MSALGLIGAVGLAFGPWQGTWKDALYGADYKTAWRLARQEPHELNGLVARAEILYRAGEPTGAWKAAEAGLRIAPSHIELLYHAAGAAIWLEEGLAALACSTRLVQAIPNAAHLSPDQKMAWEATASKFVVISRTLLRQAEERARSEKKARFLSIGSLLLTMGLIAWAAGCSYGKSSSPVS